MTGRPLRLYVNPAWRRGEAIYSPLLFPLWGNPTSEASLFSKEMFDSYPFDTRYYAVTDRIEDADMVFPPYRHNWLLQCDKALLAECATRATKAGLPLLIDGQGDIEYPLGVENAYVLRIGGWRFMPEKNRIQIPASSDDLLERCAGGVLQVRTKQDGAKPVVGFAGWTRLSPKQKMRTFIKEAPIRLRGLFDARYTTMQKGVFWRSKALDILKRSDAVTVVSLERGSFSGSTKTAEGDLRQLRQELVDLVLASDYGLDVRGDTNTSTRLYEIMSLGRIPVILDTERTFAFSDVVDYREFCLFVDYRDIKKLPERIAAFHASLTQEKFEAMQQKARDAFVRYFRTDAQMRHIVSGLTKLGVFPRH